MAKLTYSQLEGVWINAGGQQSLAPLMAAIALAESGGRSDALNPTDNGGKQSSYGLWQISTGTHATPSPNWADPDTNAKLAIGKLKSQGLGAWGTYTSGAYKRFLANGVPATAYVSAPTAVTPAQPVGDTVTDSACAWKVWGKCFASKKQIRALAASGALLMGTGLGLLGAVLLIAYGLKKPVSSLLPKRGAGHVAQSGSIT